MKSLLPIFEGSRGISTPALGGLTLAAALWLGAASLSAQNTDEIFAPPSPYPSSRYEQGWLRNPFALESRPEVQDRKSFAEDLAIATYYGSKDSPTVVIRNKKTNQRISLKQGVVSDTGMTLKSISLKPVRKEITAVLSFGGSDAEIMFDDSPPVVADAGDKTGQNPQGGSRTYPGTGTPIPGAINPPVAPNPNQRGQSLYRPKLNSPPTQDIPPVPGPGGAASPISRPTLPPVPDRGSRLKKTAPQPFNRQPLNPAATPP